jgi:rubrerythrin
MNYVSDNWCNTKEEIIEGIEDLIRKEDDNYDIYRMMLQMIETSRIHIKNINEDEDGREEWLEKDLG